MAGCDARVTGPVGVAKVCPSTVVHRQIERLEACDFFRPFRVNNIPAKRPRAQQLPTGSAWESRYLPQLNTMKLSSTFRLTLRQGANTNLALTTRSWAIAACFLSCLLSGPLPAQQLDWALKASGTGYQETAGMAVDAAGNVHVIGSFQGSMQFSAGAGSLNSVGLFDVFFAKYNTSGSLLWAKRIGATGVAGGYGIAVDAAGNVFIGGNFNGTVDFDPGPGAKNLTSAGSFDAFLAKYDDSGALLWAHAFGANLFEEARCLALDTSGNVFIAGIFNGTVDFDPGPANTALEAAGNSELYLAKYSSAGALLWARQLEGTGAERVLGMATGIGGQVYLTGHFEDSVDFDPGAGVQSLDALGDADLFFAQYDAGGALVWAKSVGGFFYEEARGIATDRFGNVYLTGRYGETVDFDPDPGIAELDNAGINDAFFAKYDADGAFLWANSIGGDGNDIGNSIAVDSFGQVCVTGQYMNTVDFDPGNDTSNLSAAGDIEIFVARYNASGEFLWAGSIGGTSMEESAAIALDAQQNIYLTGYFKGTADFNPGPASGNLQSDGEEDAFIAKFKVATTAVAEPEALAVRLYPVPATTTLQVSLPDASAAFSIALYDQAGRLLRTQQGAGGSLTLDLSGFVAGMYCVRVLSEGKEKGMVLEVVR